MTKGKSTTRRAIIITAALIAVIAVIILFSRKPSPAPAPRPLTEEERIYSYTGTVEAVKKGQLNIRLLARNNNLAEDASIEIRFTDDTVFKRFALQNKLPPHVVYAPPKIVDATYKDIHAGDEVLVHGRAEVTAKNVFKAEKVTVVESQ